MLLFALSRGGTVRDVLFKSAVMRISAVVHSAAYSRNGEGTETVTVITERKKKELDIERTELVKLLLVLSAFPVLTVPQYNTVHCNTIQLYCHVSKLLHKECAMAPS